MTTNTNPEDPVRFEAALRLFDAANAEDPNQDYIRGEAKPRELVYAERLSDWVNRLKPDASEALRLAARCQHIRRWEIPRNTFPQTREGYLQWKETLKRHHADVAGALLKEVGYPPQLIERVRSLNLKRQLKQDADCQTLEDALCLVFLENQFVELAEKTTEEKMITALRKSWAKMSAQGQEAAMGLKFPEREQRLLKLALG